jgi:glycosyltransferase involved in cell wall biosynthesis
MIANLINLYGDIAWHASSEMEKNDILKNLTQHVKIDNLFKKIHIATNLSLFSDNVFYNEKMRSDSDSCFFKICFLSRIVPIKNLDFALKILASINKEIHFCIYGPIESVEYWNSCLEIIKKMPEHIHVTYGGAVKNEDVRETISHYDLFFVPTKGENFGHVFAESLSVGVPILLSDQTPWRDLQQSGVGWDISLNQPDAFKRAILDCHANLFKDEKFYTQPCISFYKEKCENNLVVEENRNLFLKLLNEDF